MVARIGPKRPARHFLREWREYRGLTQQQIADRLETSKGQISRWENGGRGMTVDVQAALAEALDIDPADIFRSPHQPSVDALLRNQTPDLRAEVMALVETLIKMRKAS